MTEANASAPHVCVCVMSSVSEVEVCVFLVVSLMLYLYTEFKMNTHYVAAFIIESLSRVLKVLFVFVFHFFFNIPYMWNITEPTK